MPIINRIAEYHEDMKTWRRYLHAHPELQFDCHNTAAFVAERLREFGVDEIHQGIAQTGIVAIINGQGDGPTIGLRADMDALPIIEAGSPEYKSTIDGKMHACGHDGHTTMLLGAARYLAETRNFKGRVALTFQPAEEGGGGAHVMVKEGIMDRFNISEVYGIHNGPNMPEGHILMRPGPMLAAADGFVITIAGKGGHGAMPHETIDPLPAMVGIYQAVQTISSRNIYALDSTVISITVMEAGKAFNVVPDAARLCGTFRTLQKSSRETVMRRFNEICENTASAYGCTANIEWTFGAPATVNHSEQTKFAAKVARDVAVGVDDNFDPLMGSEDFSYMLEERPGTYVFLGAGPGAGLHHPEYDFNDEISPVGASFFVKLVETSQPLSG
ncbi:MAG: M20 family metallopeptidase [Proteobacteria bacterium]|nr:M20 family metallopeptidase [Pseudomonadota bacterium]MDA1286714.1 M20 family metallopeptidase [Pseudomonadota bacterium]